MKFTSYTAVKTKLIITFLTATETNRRNLKEFAIAKRVIIK